MACGPRAATMRTPDPSAASRRCRSRYNCRTSGISPCSLGSAGCISASASSPPGTRLDRGRRVVMPDNAGAERRRLRGHAVLHPETRHPGDVGKARRAGPGSSAARDRDAGSSRACRRRRSRAATGCRRSGPPASGRPSRLASHGQKAIPGIHAPFLPSQTLARQAPGVCRRTARTISSGCRTTFSQPAAHPSSVPQQEADGLGAQAATVAAQRWSAAA